MKQALLIVVIMITVLISGCAFLNKVAPSEVDAEGNPIAGTHELAEPYKSVADQIPYADVVIGILLLGWNGYERYRRDKAEKGLLATAKAIKTVLDDPSTKSDIDNLKAELKKAHDAADITPYIKSILAKI